MPGMPGMGGGMPYMAQMGSAMGQIMQNPQMQEMMQNMTGGGAPPPGAGGNEMPGMPPGMPPGMEQMMGGMDPRAMQAGMQMAQQMMAENPDAVEEMRRQFLQSMGGSPPQ